MIFSYKRLETAVAELEGTGLKEKEFILWCLKTYCPSVPSARAPSLGQVLASAHEAWRRATGDHEAQFPILESSDGE